MRYHTFNEPLERDITTYAVIAHELLMGKSLYLDLWDHKPPAIYFTFVAAELLLGYGTHAVYVLGVAATVSTLIAIYLAGKSISPPSSVIAAAFWTLVSGDLYLQANQPNVEVFMNASITWAFALLLTLHRVRFWIPQALAVGALFALASLYKPVALAPAFLLATAHLLFPPARTTRRAALIASTTIFAAMGSIWLAVIILTLSSGTITAFKKAVFDYNIFYTGHILDNILFGTAFLGPSTNISALRLTLPLGLLTLVGAITGFRHAGRPWLLLCTWLLGTHLSVLAPGKNFPHYYQLWLPPLCIGTGWSLAVLHVHSRWRVRWLSRVAALTVFLLLLYQVALWYHLPAELWSRLKYGEGVFVASERLGRQLDAMLEQNEAFYEWGSETGLYFYSKRRPPTGVFYHFPLLAGPLAQELSQRVYDDLTKVKPKVLVVRQRPPLDSTETEHPLFRALLQEYELLPVLADDEGFFAVYIRKSSRMGESLSSKSA